MHNKLKRRPGLSIAATAACLLAITLCGCSSRKSENDEKNIDLIERNKRKLADKIEPEMTKRGYARSDELSFFSKRIENPFFYPGYTIFYQTGTYDIDEKSISLGHRNICGKIFEEKKINKEVKSYPLPAKFFHDKAKQSYFSDGNGTYISCVGEDRFCDIMYIKDKIHIYNAAIDKTKVCRYQDVLKEI